MKMSKTDSLVFFPTICKAYVYEAYIFPWIGIPTNYGQKSGMVSSIQDPEIPIDH